MGIIAVTYLGYIAIIVALIQQKNKGGDNSSPTTITTNIFIIFI